MKIKNPVFSGIDIDVDVVNKASMLGVTAKTAILLAVTFISAIAIMVNGYYSLISLAIVSVIGVIAVIIGRSNANVASIASIVYAICEGVLLGTISGIVSSVSGFEGAVPIAITATLTIFLTMLVMYSIKVVSVTPTLVKVMSAAGVSILVFFMISFIMSLFGASSIMTMFYENTIFAALLCVLFIAYGSFMLVFNFNEAQTYVENGFDKKFEWVAALGLIISIIYIYIQVLRFVILIMARKK